MIQHVNGFEHKWTKIVYVCRDRSQNYGYWCVHDLMSTDDNKKQTQQWTSTRKGLNMHTLQGEKHF